TREDGSGYPRFIRPRPNIGPGLHDGFDEVYGAFLRRIVQGRFGTFASRQVYVRAGTYQQSQHVYVPHATIHCDLNGPRATAGHPRVENSVRIGADLEEGFEDI